MNNSIGYGLILVYMASALVLLWLLLVWLFYIIKKDLNRLRKKDDYE